MLSAGKYDRAAQEALDSTGAKGVILIVIDGAQGHGMSVKADADTMAIIPNLLIMTANEIQQAIDKDLEQIARMMAGTKEKEPDFHPLNVKVKANVEPSASAATGYAPKAEPPKENEPA